MYSRKSVGPRIKSWGTTVLTGYSWEHLPLRTTWSHQLLRKEEITKYLTWNSIDLSLWSRAACLTLSKALDISSATAQVDPQLLKAPAILSDTTVRRSAVDQEDLKPYWESEKKPNFSRWSTILSFTSFSNTLLTTEKRLTGQFLAVNLSPAFLNTGAIAETFQQSGKQDSLDTYWRVQLVCKKVQAHGSLEPPLRYNQDQTPFINQGWLWPF